MYSARSHCNLLIQKNEATSVVSLLLFFGVVMFLLIGQNYDLGALELALIITDQSPSRVSTFSKALILIWLASLQYMLVSWIISVSRLRRYERVHGIEDVESTRNGLLYREDQYT